MIHGAASFIPFVRDFFFLENCRVGGHRNFPPLPFGASGRSTGVLLFLFFGDNVLSSITGQLQCFLLNRCNQLTWGV